MSSTKPVPGAKNIEEFWSEKLPQTDQIRTLMERLDFPGGSVVKNPLLMQEMWVQSLVQEDPLEKKMATHSSIRAWDIPWTEDPGGLRSLGLQKSQKWLRTTMEMIGFTWSSELPLLRD